MAFKEKEQDEKETMHPIERIMTTAMTKIRTLVDADTIVGNPITTVDGVVVIPVSKVSMGFVTGGGEYDATCVKNMQAFPFAGGSGAGVCVSPIGFLIKTDGDFRMVSVDGETTYGKLLEMLPKLIINLTKSSKDKEKEKLLEVELKKLKKQKNK